MVTEGTPVLLVGDQAVQCSPGTGFVVGKECPVGWRDEPGKASRVLFWIWDGIPGISEMRPPETQWLQYQFSLKSLPAFERLHRDCRRQLAMLDDYSAASLERCRIELEVTWMRSKECLSQADPCERVEAAMEWMHRHLDATHPISDVCDRLQISEATLHRDFKKLRDCSPLAAFQEIKALRAGDLVAEGLQIKEVAYLLGYRHVNDFTRFYRKRFGHPPTDSMRQRSGTGLKTQMTCPAAGNDMPMVAPVNIHLSVFRGAANEKKADAAATISAKRKLVGIA
jgi:AraC family transcriptional regulator of arabinose operon